MNVAGARLNVPPVLLEVWLTLIVAEPSATGVTVSVLVSPQDVKVTELGLTVATAVLLDETDRPSVVLPVRLQPFLPSPFRGATYSCVVPFAPPSLSGMTSATASMVGSRLLEMSSAPATPTIEAAAIVAPSSTPRLRRGSSRPDRIALSLLRESLRLETPHNDLHVVRSSVAMPRTDARVSCLTLRTATSALSGCAACRHPIDTEHLTAQSHHHPGSGATRPAKLDGC